MGAWGTKPSTNAEGCDGVAQTPHPLYFLDAHFLHTQYISHDKGMQKTSNGASSESAAWLAAHFPFVNPPSTWAQLLALYTIASCA